MADRPMLPPLPEELDKLLTAMNDAYANMGSQTWDGAEHMVASHAAFEAEHAFRTALMRALGQGS